MFRGNEYHVPVNRSAVSKQLFLNHKGAKDTDGELWFFASNSGGRAGRRCAPMSYHSPKTGDRKAETGKEILSHAEAQRRGGPDRTGIQRSTDAFPRATQRHDLTT
jgi:hypothetical protein